jgi:hypothetical protein
VMKWQRKKGFDCLIDSTDFYAPTALGGEEFSIMHYHPMTYYA